MTYNYNGNEFQLIDGCTPDFIEGYREDQYGYIHMLRINFGVTNEWTMHKYTMAHVLQNAEFKRELHTAVEEREIA